MIVSYHQKSVKSFPLFKLMVQRDSAVKRYEFEAKRAKLANAFYPSYFFFGFGVEMSFFFW
jgi:hypothetical protein